MPSNRHSLSNRSTQFDPIASVERAVEMDAKGRRFPCVCGVTTTDGGTALVHFASHGDVGIEEYRNGEWHAAPFKNIGVWMYMRLRARGESPGEFLGRIQSAAERAKEAVALTEDN